MKYKIVENNGSYAVYYRGFFGNWLQYIAMIPAIYQSDGWYGKLSSAKIALEHLKKIDGVNTLTKIVYSE